MTKLDKRLKYQNDDEKPVTISMRLPKELHTRLEQYATQHRQSISELVRDGLEWRLSEGDPRGLGDASAKDDEAYYMSNTADALADMRQALARQEAQIQTIVQALERQTTPAGNGLYSSHTTMPATEVAVSYQEAAYTQRPALADEQIPDSPMPAAVPPHDPSKYRLGKLCPKGHDYHGTGQSLLRKHNKHCRECENEAKRAARQAKRQAPAL
jgi:hypothetical protein